MIKLRPILKNDATETEKWLLRSARLDVPPVSGKRRALAALGFAAAATTTASASGVAAAATAGAGWVIKCIAVGAVGGVIVAGAVEGVTAMVGEAPRERSQAIIAPVMAASSARAPRLPAAPQMEPPPSEEEVRAESAPASDPAPSIPPITNTSPIMNTSQREVAPAARVEPSLALAPEQESRPTGATLAQEVRTLDEARRALASGDVEVCMAVLDAYDLRIAAPRLKLEAAVLRIEALLAEGQYDRAHDLGEQLLVKDPHGAYAQHVRSLLAGRAQ